VVPPPSGASNFEIFGSVEQLRAFKKRGGLNRKSNAVAVRPQCGDSQRLCDQILKGHLLLLLLYQFTSRKILYIMASVQSLRNLVRPAIPVAPRIQPIMLSLAAAFSTSSFLSAAAPPAVKSRKDLPKKMKKTYKKKQNVVPVKKPGPGERKAFRKRIQLSNNSALPVTGIENLEAQTMAKEESSGKMFAVPDQLVDQLRALEAFKTTQTWNLFRKPHVLVRKETVDLMSKLEASVEKKEALKCVLTGSRLSGKSLTLLQAMSYALQNEWVVIHIPEGIFYPRRQKALIHERQREGNYS
jgi:hypothetical protein